MSLSSTPPRIAVIGCGLGGAALGLLLEQAGFPFTIYEQAPEFLRIGAGIHLTPNVTRILDSAGVTEQLLQQGSQPRAFTSRDGRTGEVIAEMPLGEAAREQYGAPYLTVHRGDFHAAMVGRLPGGKIEFGKRLSTVDVTDGPVVLRFTDGTAAEADLVVGADGLSSVVRGQIRGGQQPHFAGQVAYRATVDPRSLSQLPPDDLTKWWLGERFIIGYYLTRERDQYYFVAGRDAASWPEECASLPASKEELLADFADFPAEARAILQAAKEVRLWPLHEREPDTTWSRGPLGDAGHPMRPHMAQRWPSKTRRCWCAAYGRTVPLPGQPTTTTSRRGRSGWRRSKKCLPKTAGCGRRRTRSGCSAMMRCLRRCVDPDGFPFRALSA